MRTWTALPLVAALFLPVPSSPADARAVASTYGREAVPSDDCAACHPEVHAEWQRSRHATAFTDPVYQRALRDLEHPERCHGCHAPEPVLSRLGRPPRARTDDLHAGVTCAACHDARGRIAGPFGAANDAHESSQHPAFTERGTQHLCGSCHDMRIGPVLPLTRDFVAAGLADRGKSCTGCHMPAVRRVIAFDPATGAPTGPVRRARSHALRGPSDPEFCADAFKLGLRADGPDRVELSIGNRAGHRVPGLTTRAFTFRVVQRDAAGAALRRDVVTLSAQNPLFAAETRRFRFPRVAAAVRIELRGHHEHGDAPPVEFVADDRDL